jgi:hypothetical protein
MRESAFALPGSDSGYRLGWVMKLLGLRRLRNLAPKAPVQCYQWEKPGEKIHSDNWPQASPQE